MSTTWRWPPQLFAAVGCEFARRSIPPGVRTACPRASKRWDDPETGLVSVVALFVARAVLGDFDPTLLDGYHWKETFLAGLPQF